MSSGVARVFEDGGAGPQLPGTVVVDPLPTRLRPFHIDFDFGLPLPRLFGRWGSLVYSVSPPAMREVAKSCTEAQFGAHVPSSRPREKPLDGLARPLEPALGLPIRGAIGLTRLLAEGVCPGVRVVVAVVEAEAEAEACMPLWPRRLRGLMPASLSKPACMRPVEGIGAGREGSAMVVGGFV